MQVVLEFWTSSAASLKTAFPPPILEPTTLEAGLLFPSCQASPASTGCTVPPCRYMDLQGATQVS